MPPLDPGADVSEMLRYEHSPSFHAGVSSQQAQPATGNQRNEARESRSPLAHSDHTEGSARVSNNLAFGHGTGNSIEIGPNGDVSIAKKGGRNPIDPSGAAHFK